MLGHHTLDGFHRVGIDHRCSIFEPVRGTFEGHVPSATKNQMISDIKYVVVLVLFLLVSWKGFKEKPFFQKGIKKIAGKKGAPQNPKPNGKLLSRFFPLFLNYGLLPCCSFVSCPRL